MATKGHIEATDRGIDHIADQRIGRERGIRIEESGREATKDEGMMIGHHAGHGSGGTPQTHLDGEGIRDIEITNTEDDEG